MHPARISQELNAVITLKWLEVIDKTISQIGWNAAWERFAVIPINEVLAHEALQGDNHVAI